MVMLLNKVVVKILIFLFILTVLATVVFLLIIAKEPLWEIDQLNRTPNSSFVNLSPQASLSQEFVSQDDWSTILVQRKIRGDQLKYTITAKLLIDDVLVRELSGSVGEFIRPLPDILIRNVDYNFIRDVEWLTFNFADVDAMGKKARLVLITNYEAAPYLSFVIQEASEKYAAGSLFINDKLWKGDLGFVTLGETTWRERLEYRLVDQSQLFYLMIVILVCLVVSLGLSAYLKVTSISFVLLLMILALVFTLPLYIDSSTIGVWDWPEAASHYSAARLSLSAGEFPLWTPQFCGGAPMWQSPQPYWPSLTFLITLLFGDLVGTRLAITIYIFLGLWGMSKLSRYLGLIYPFVLIPAVIFMFSGFFLSHLAAGQMLWLTVAWVPWVVYFFLKSLKKSWLVVPSVLFYLMTFFEGRVYITVYLTILILLLALVVGYMEKKWKQVAVRLISFALLVIGLGAIKIAPTIDFLSNFGGGLVLEDGIPIMRLLEAMTTRTAELEYTQAWMYLPWHEYAAYVGIVPLLLALLGVFVVMKTKRPVYVALIVSALLFLFVATSKTNTNPFNLFPILKQLHVPSRSILMVIFSISLLAGLGAQTLIKRGAWQKVFGSLLVLFLFVNLFVIGSEAWNNIFSQKHKRLEGVSSFYQSSFNSDNAYHLTEAGVGAKDYCPTYLRTWYSNAKIYGHEEENYMGEVYVSGSSVASLSELTPNSVAVLIEDVEESDTVFINQKYSAGWRSKDRELFSDKGRLAFNITEKDEGKVIVIKYLPKSFVIGGLITLFSVALLISWGGWCFVKKGEKHLGN